MKLPVLHLATTSSTALWTPACLPPAEPTPRPLANQTTVVAAMQSSLMPVGVM